MMIFFLVTLAVLLALALVVCGFVADDNYTLRKEKLTLAKSAEMWQEACNHAGQRTINLLGENQRLKDITAKQDAQIEKLCQNYNGVIKRLDSCQQESEEYRKQCEAANVDGLKRQLDALDAKCEEHEKTVEHLTKALVEMAARQCWAAQWFGGRPWALCKKEWGETSSGKKDEYREKGRVAVQKGEANNWMT